MHLFLIVEGDSATRSVPCALLGAEHYRCIEADTVLKAETQARTRKPDLLLVDLGLPDGDGIQVIRQVRGWSPILIVVLSGSTQEERKMASLDAGADDYVNKPFVAPELIARIRAAMRKTFRCREPASELILGDARIDLIHREARSPGGDIHLTPLEYRMLECLARNLGYIVAEDQLVREVWGPEHLQDTHYLRVCIRHLREKLEPIAARPRYLINEMGVGYRLRSDHGPPTPEGPPG